MGFIPSWAIGAAVILFAYALAQIVVVKLRASVRLPQVPNQELGELQQALDAMQGRIGELEERVDFTERLLAKQHETGQLPPPAG